MSDGMQTKDAEDFYEAFFYACLLQLGPPPDFVEILNTERGLEGEFYRKFAKLREKYFFPNCFGPTYYAYESWCRKLSADT